MAAVFAVPRDGVPLRNMMTPEPWPRMWRAAERAVMNCEVMIVLIGIMNLSTGSVIVSVALPYSTG